MAKRKALPTVGSLLTIFYYEASSLKVVYIEVLKLDIYYVMIQLEIIKYRAKIEIYINLNIKSRKKTPLKNLQTC